MEVAVCGCHFGSCLHVIGQPYLLDRLDYAFDHHLPVYLPYSRDISEYILVAAK